jgi:hypothetical protein
MSGMGIKFEDELLGLFLLLSLLESWETFRVSITSSAPKGVAPKGVASISERTHKPNTLRFWVKSMVSNSHVKLFLNPIWMIP